MRYISRHFEDTVNGRVVHIEKGNPLVLPGAVLMQFPNLPHYLLKNLSASRKHAIRSVAAAPPHKKIALDDLPNNFQRIKVNLAFHVFSILLVLRGEWGAPEPTQAFGLLMWKLVKAVPASTPSEGLKT
ncbi:hypothetical protein HPB50_005341 [Hyalomma asiaticum]|uniref:Uncharacterized protein n=1 Tax=Hyalomma asiaticum TaxID=266040 RepID=A0ACB7SK72_HYAAI|nr:hypothetical protein HPB50_005341 [Hyalomma asiaticum]